MGYFRKLPWVNFHELNLDWIVKKLKEMDTKLDNIVSDHDAVVDLQTRMTAAEGNITNLSGRMTSAETKLNKIPLPEVSDIGKVLGAVADGASAKLSYVTDQTGGDVPTPAAGDNGKVLTAGSGGSYSWETAPTGNDVPTPGSGDNGKVLTAGSGGTYSWQTAGGGSGLSLVAYRTAYCSVGDGAGGALDFDENSTDLTVAQQQQLQSEISAAYLQGAEAFYDYMEKHFVCYASGHRMLYKGDASTPGATAVSLGCEFLWYVNINNVMTQVIAKPSFGIAFNDHNFIGFQNKNCVLPGTNSSITPTDITGVLPKIDFTIAVYM